MALKKSIRSRIERRVGRRLHLLRSRLRLLMHGGDRLPVVKLESIIGQDISIAPPILDNICLPPYFGPEDHDDYAPLMKIIKFIQPRVVVELGTAQGNLTANICRESPLTKVYTVNSPVESQTGTFVTYELTQDEIGKVYRDHGFADRVVQIFENTLDLNLSEYFQDPVVDLAIIDACHDTDYVINDFSKVRNHVGPQGLVMFHDTHPSMKGHLLGSYMACMKLRQQGYDIRHIQGTWWAIWTNGEADP